MDNFISNEPIPSVEEEPDLEDGSSKLASWVINSYAKQLVCQSDTNLVSLVMMREQAGAVYPTEQELCHRKAGAC